MEQPEDRVICLCHCISESVIREAIRKGAKTIEEIRAATKANTGCGGCAEEIMRILKSEGIL